MAPLAEAFVRVRAQTSGVRRDVDREFNSAGRDAERSFSRGFTGGGLLRGAARVLARNLGGGNEWQQQGQRSGQQFGQGFGAGFSRDSQGRLHDQLGRYVSESAARGRDSGQQFSQQFGSAASQGSPAISINIGPAMAAIQQLGIGLLSLAAIPVGATAIVGLSGLAGAAAAAGVGVLGLQAVAVPAFNRIAAAIKAEEAAKLQSGAASVQAQGRALALAGAQQALASAVRNSGYAHRQALESVRAAVSGLAQAQRGALSAQQALTRARQDAARALQDQANQVTSGRLALRADELAVDRARLALQQLTSARQDDAAAAKAQQGLAAAQASAAKVLADPAATEAQKAAAREAVAAAQAAVNAARQQRAEHALERREAKLAYEQAVQQLREQQVAQQRLEADSKKAAKAGVEGSDQVKSARERLREANLQVASSERALAQARANVARTDSQSADAVASARRALAQASLQGAAGNAALTKALSDLSPAERKLKADLEGLTGAFDKWQRSMEPTVLPLFSRGINILKGQLPSLTPFVKGAAEGFDSLLDRVERGAKGSEFAQFKKQLASLTGPSVEGLGNSAINVAVGFGRMFQAFLPYAPIALDYLERLSVKFRDWAGSNFSGGGSEGFKSFIEYVKTAAPQVLVTLQEVAAAVQHVAVALAPLAGTAGLGALGTIRLLAVAVQGLSPGQIQAIAIALVALKVAMLGVAAARGAGPAIGLIGTAIGGLRTGASAAAGFVAGFRNVNMAFSDGATRANTLGAALRSQLQRWRQQAAAARASAAATLASARANATARASAAGNWISSQAAAFRAAAAARWADTRAAAANAAANARARASAAGSWLAAQAVALRATAAAHLANARAATAGAIANLRQRAAAIGSAVAAAAVRVATIAWTAVQWALNAALAANPIGLIVLAIVGLVAGVVLAYNKITWFRTGVNATFAFLKTAVVGTINFIRNYWKLIITIILGPLGLVIALVATYWRQIYNVIATAVGWVIGFVRSHWRLILAIVLGPLGLLIGLVTKYWRQITGAVVAAVNFVVGWVRSHWRLLIGIIGGPIGIAVGLVIRHWNSIKSATTSMINTIKGGISRGLNAVRNSFATGVTAIGKAWDRMKSVTKSPVNFVINTVYNKGIRGLWNKVIGWLHLPKDLQLGSIPQLEAGGTVDNPRRVGSGGTYSRATAIVGEGNTTRPEFVIPTDPAHRSRAQALWAAAGHKLQMLEGGGILGGIWKGIKKSASKVADIGKLGLSLIEDPKKVWDELATKMVPGAAHLATSPWGTAIAAIPKKLLDTSWTAARSLIEAFKSGYGSGGTTGVVRAAERLIGRGDDRGVDNNNMFTRHYGWGSGTPWCALFASYAIDQAKARKQYRGAPTAAVATFNASMKHVPVNTGRPGDLATYGSNDHVNIIAKKIRDGLYETIGGNEGPRVKRSQRGGQASVLRPMATGGIVGEVFRQRNFDRRDRHNPLLGAYRRLAPVLFDRGGMLPTGPHNRSGRPEPVLTGGQWDDIHTLARRGSHGGPAIGELHLHALPGIPSDQQISSAVDRALYMHGDW